MKILVTGGSGFIGSNLVEKLLNQGHSIINLDNLDPFYDLKIKARNVAKAKTHPNYKMIVGDIRDKNLIDNIFENEGIELVVHLAAKAGVRPSLHQPELYYDVNVMGTLRLLESMRKVGLKKMVMASSSSVYGNNKKVPFSESDSVDNPASPYAATKKSCELLAYNFHHLYDFDISCLRFFSVYGPGQRPEMAIAKFTSKILKEEPIPVYGDGSSSRDYTYVDDISQGIIQSIDNLNGYNIYNLGESETITLAALIELLESVIGKKAIIDRMPMQPGDVMTTFADISKSQEELGYTPSTSIREGVENYVNWFIQTSEEIRELSPVA